MTALGVVLYAAVLIGAVWLLVLLSPGQAIEKFAERLAAHVHVWPDKLRRQAPLWPGEVCKRCYRRNVIGFTVEHAVWASVVRGRWNVLCPTCFDEEAQLAGIVYSFGDLHPVSWSGWKE